jgi:hypothetical protein
MAYEHERDEAVCRVNMPRDVLWSFVSFVLVNDTGSNKMASEVKRFMKDDEMDTVAKEASIMGLVNTFF